METFRFNLRELAGSMGDFGTLFPLAIGYITTSDMDRCGMFSRDALINFDLISVAVTITCSAAFKMAAGFAAGLVVYYLLAPHQGDR